MAAGMLRGLAASLLLAAAACDRRATEQDLAELIAAIRSGCGVTVQVGSRTWPAPGTGHRLHAENPTTREVTADLADDGQIAVDADWSRLNAGAFRYGDGAGVADTPYGETPSSVVPGLLSDYSRTDVAEDKAEVFAWLLVDPAAVHARAQADPVLQAKVAAMRERLRRCSTDADDAWLQRVAAARQQQRSR